MCKSKKYRQHNGQKSTSWKHGKSKWHTMYINYRETRRYNQRTDDAVEKLDSVSIPGLGCTNIN